MLDQEECRMLLFDNVENSAELHSKVMSGEDLGCVLIKPSLILDPLQVNIAVFKAKHSPKMTTRSIYTEVLYNLGPTKNIGASLKTFGLTGQEKEILAVILDTSKSEESVVSLIKGNQKKLGCLSEFTDIQQIMKLYKLSALKQDQHKEIKDSVISRIAAKDVI